MSMAKRNTTSRSQGVFQQLLFATTEDDPLSQDCSRVRDTTFFLFTPMLNQTWGLANIDKSYTVETSYFIKFDRTMRPYKSFFLST